MVPVCSKGEHLRVPGRPKCQRRLPQLCLALPGCGSPAAVPPPGWLVPVVPVEVFEVFVVRDVYLVDLPGALVVWQVFPLDQVMDVSLFIKAETQGTKSLSVK